MLAATRDAYSVGQGDKDEGTKQKSLSESSQGPPERLGGSGAGPTESMRSPSHGESTGSGMPASLSSMQQSYSQAQERVTSGQTEERAPVRSPQTTDVAEPSLPQLSVLQGLADAPSQPHRGMAAVPNAEKAGSGEGGLDREADAASSRSLENPRQPDYSRSAKAKPSLNYSQLAGNPPASNLTLSSSGQTSSEHGGEDLLQSEAKLISALSAMHGRDASHGREGKEASAASPERVPEEGEVLPQAVAEGADPLSNARCTLMMYLKLH